MNPDTGKLHEIARDLAGIERIAKGERPREETAEDVLARAEEVGREVRKNSTEPTPGTEVPPDWPRFSIGDRIGPIKGWWFELLDVDVETQEMLIKPSAPTKATRERRAGRRKRRRRR